MSFESTRSSKQSSSDVAFVQNILRGIAPNPNRETSTFESLSIRYLPSGTLFKLFCSDYMLHQHCKRTTRPYPSSLERKRLLSTQDTARKTYMLALTTSLIISTVARRLLRRTTRLLALTHSYGLCSAMAAVVFAGWYFARPTSILTANSLAAIELELSRLGMTPADVELSCAEVGIERRDK